MLGNDDSNGRKECSVPAKKRKATAAYEWPKTVADLKPAEYNPRTLAPEAAAGLAFSMDAFGDVAGITYNARTGNLVSGHQRVAQLPPEAVLGPVAPMPDDKGTVGTSVIEHDGARWPVRIVDWDEPREKAANLAANNAALQGTFTDGVVPMLADLETQLPELWDGLRLADIEAPGVLGGEGDGANVNIPSNPTYFELVLAFTDENGVREAYEELKEDHECRLLIY